ncbi:MAG: Mur ligase family protein [Bacteroidota bacterium]|nr:Mur ligase family protein [Bacteroidota bacterium]
MKGKVHFIAVGGSVMHNLAITLKQLGYEVSGSDDKIYDPSRSRLEKHNLLPKDLGWFPELIDKEIDFIVLGMHAKKDNPELLKAQELDCKIYSYPELIFEFSKSKTRITIGGSHGKTTVSSMILHVLDFYDIKVDYLLGAQIEGFENMVHITDDNEFILIEGDEYLSSPIDNSPKFHKYNSNIAVITGIAWDHINVFPSFENYTSQFEKFIETITDGGVLVFNELDELVLDIVNKSEKTIRKIGYGKPNFEIVDGVTYVKTSEGDVPLKVFGDHNLSNLSAAKQICALMGVFDDEFFAAIASFKGASKRLETIYRDNNKIIIKDFAHSPSKLKATIVAVKNQFSNKNIIAVYELHTYSSFNQKFIKEYLNSMSSADKKIVYYDDEVLKKRSEFKINEKIIKDSFGSDDLIVISKKSMLEQSLSKINLYNSVLLMMSSGNFSSIDMLSVVKNNN